ncbi:hypothetical protein [Pleionea sp. CnH1-48]|uniref:hypothetical protein n=1 Tax=Pleionea sp. CnH1-48 TaxID=2954494 RepID=UPI002096D143|nr:hypothetical protein [Pleionea sp. CnH1-48]MCO7227309.1 hypothetical protein [Pleionea sp. CnH1-48]
MAFIFERPSEEDIKKYELESLYKKYQAAWYYNDDGEKYYQNIGWILEREKDIFVLPISKKYYSRYPDNCWTWIIKVDSKIAKAVFQQKENSYYDKKHDVVKLFWKLKFIKHMHIKSRTKEEILSMLSQALELYIGSPYSMEERNYLSRFEF